MPVPVIKFLFQSLHGILLVQHPPIKKKIPYFKGADNYMVVPASDFSDETLILYPVTFRHLLSQIRVVSTGCVVSCLVTSSVSAGSAFFRRPA